MVEGNGGTLESPSNLLPPPPRVVRYRSWGGVAGLWFVRLFILPHTVIGLAMLGKLLLSILLALAGTTSNGQIVRAWIDPGGKHGSSHHRIAYTDATLANRQRTAEVSRSFYASLPIEAINSGSLTPGIPVRTFELGMIDLATVITDQFLPGGLELEWFFVAIFWNGLLSVFVYMAYIYPVRLRRVYRSGVETRGVVDSKLISRGKRTSYRIECVFQSADGQPRRTAETVSKEVFESVTQGQSVRILYLPAAPKRAAVYDLGLYQVLDGNSRPIT